MMLLLYHWERIMASNGFEDLYGPGENPNGFRALVPNGVASDRGAGANHQYNWGPNINGPRWEMPVPEYPMGCGMPVGTPGTPGSGRRGSRNRTGE
jgi:hypothetical protein